MRITVPQISCPVLTASIRAKFESDCLERGQALALAAICLSVMLAAAGFTLDVGLGRIQQRDAQNAADAAALAGAQDLPGTPATPTQAEQTAAQNDATTYASTNGFSAGSGITVTVNTPPLTGAHTNDSTSIEVIITKQVPTLIARLFNKNSIAVTARSVATATPGVTKCVLCVLDPSASGALTASGNGTVTVAGGGVVVDSSSSTAGVLSGNSDISDTDALLSTRIGVVGPGGNGGCTQVSGNAQFNPGANCGINSVADPLSSVPVPDVLGPSNGSVSLSGNSTQTINPGIYSSLSVSANGVLTMNPGVYVLTGGSSALSLSGNAALTGSGVVIYFACSSYPTACNSSGQAGAGMSLSGNGAFHVAAPTSATCQAQPSTCSYEGLSVFYDRKNTAALTLSGNGNDSWAGTIYAPSAPATLSGNGGTFQLNSFVVVDKVTLSGNGALNLSFSQNQNYQAGGAPGAADLTE